MLTGKYNKIQLEPFEEQYIRSHFYKMTNRELADSLGLRLTKLREFAYAMGLKRIEMEYWTSEQVTFLKEHYQCLGDTEIAEIFQMKFHKNKGWNKKHIEKKRRYLKLKRTKSQIKAIHNRNVLLGRFKICNQKMWATRGISPIGTIKIWFTSYNRPYLVIKQKTGFVHYNRWLWEKEKGPIPEGMNVCIMIDSLEYTIDDLQLLTNSELAVRNSKNRTPKELSEAMNLYRKINKELNKL